MNIGRSVIWVGAYIAAIVLVNWLFTPPYVDIFSWPTLFGQIYLSNIIVGLVFVLRDYSQRAIGHYVLVATAAAGLITYVMVDPQLAMASLTAFVISEMADWAVYSFTRRPLQERILVSSLISVPLDTLAFQYLANYLTPAAFSLEMVSKAIGVLIVWQILRMRLRAAPAV